MKKYTMLFAAMVLLFLSGIPNVYSYGREDKNCPGDKGMGCHKPCCRESGLTEEQKKNMEESKRKHMEEMKGIINKIKDKNALLAGEFKKEKPDMGAINKIGADLKKLKGEEVDCKIKHLSELKKILPAETLAKIAGGMCMEGGMGQGCNFGREGKRGPEHFWGKGMMGIRRPGFGGMPNCDTGARITSSPDGGVFVLKGNMLYKYDKDLNMLKEVKIGQDKSGEREEEAGTPEMKH